MHGRYVRHVASTCEWVEPVSGGGITYIGCMVNSFLLVACGGV